MKVLRSLSIVLVILLLASAAGAQQTKMKVAIPFDFYAGDQFYPAGEYVLNSMSNNNAVIRIDGHPLTSAVYLSSNTCADTRPSHQTKLVFHRLGENYFLYQAWIAGNFDGRQFPLSRAETRMAQNGDKPENIAVAARLMN